MNKKIKNFGGDGFIRILSEWREKINKLAERINPGNLEKKEVVIKKIGSKSISEKKSSNRKKKNKKHIKLFIN